ncbi:hypothetical protein [Enterobacter vonholyi]|uniref:hypothetical protein n=1 Tax=Enterobacter vonholyi TaxID=2797505 RepID=UPI0032B3CDA3
MLGNIYGCLVNEELLIDFNNNRLVRIHTNKSDKSFLIGAVIVSNAVISLLEYILVDIDANDVVSKEMILNNVFDRLDYISSTQKLWTVLKELNQRLRSIGIDYDLIKKVRNSEYARTNVNVKILCFQECKYFNEPNYATRN